MFKKLNFRTQLLILSLIPFIGLVYFAGKNVVQYQERYESSAVAQVNVELSQYIGDLIHHLQIERGYSLLYLRSKDELFYNKLQDRRAISANQLNVLSGKLNELQVNDTIYLNLFERNEKINGKIRGLRWGVDQQVILGKEAFASYSLIIEEYISIVDEFIRKLDRDKLIELSNNYIDIIKYKECIGVERAKFGEALLMDHLTFADISRLSNISSRKYTFKSIFLKRASFNYKNKVNAVNSDEEFQVIPLIETELLNNGKLEKYVITADDWFTLLTHQIDRLEIVQEEIARDLEKLVTDFYKSERNGLLLALGSVVFTMLVSITLVSLIVKNITHLIGGEPQEVKTAIEQLRDDQTPIIQKKEGEILTGIYKAVDEMKATFEEKRKVLLDALNQVSDYKYAIDESAIVSISDQYGQISHVNNLFAEVSGYTKSEMIGENHRKLNSNFHSKEYFRELWETLLQGNAWQGEIRNKRKDGSYYWIKTTLVPFVNQENQPYQFIEIAFDITKEKEQLIEIQKKNAQLDQFAYVVSHDFKVPLRGISTLAEFIEEDLEGQIDGEVLQNFSLLKDRAKRMESLINDILHYSKIGRSESESSNCDLNTLMEEVKESLIIPEQFKIEVTDCLPTLFAPRPYLYQAFSHVVLNAIKYNDKEQGELAISFENHEDQILLKFKDNGPGIEPQFHEKIFQVFQTLSNEKEAESTGIGLSIVKKTCEELGGDITLESEIGVGTTFMITLPKRLVV